MANLVGKVALVTGAGSGIGRASAIAFAAAGAHVIVSDIDEDGGNQTAAAIQAAGHQAVFVAADVSNSNSVDALVKESVRRFGRLDCAHNNAGVESAIAPIADSTEADWDKTIAVNLKGVWLCMRAELRQMVLQGHGVIVNTASVGGLTGVPGNAAYSASKHGVVGLSRTAALEYATAGIRVNAICPGLTRSGMTDRLIKVAPDLIRSIMPPMQRIAEPEEIASVAVFVCSDEASYMSGQAIAIDGAATAA
jgi:NAD(P)-dependent dehydrogenase (short-subunit alcohol dehydrogenase family)